SAAVIASYGQWLRLACSTGFNGCTAARRTGFVVEPPMASALPVRPSAVRGAKGRGISCAAGFVVMSLTANAMPFDTLPYRRWL
ncbi:hypothetical protein, partial [Cupriavidus basilensis]|uniref:hypothetical protein n=1 Tax=Cupriavidus basilensis TaxID=68895 RepID=UPI0023E79746